MKLNYDRKSNNPTYFIQQGFRNGKKTSTRNVAVIGKHSDLLKITDDPLAYAKQKVVEYNEQYKQNKFTMEVSIDFEQKLRDTGELVSRGTACNIGYFFLQALYHKLALGEFFEQVLKHRKITFDPNLVNRFLTYARILNPESKLATVSHLGGYYEQPEFQHQHVLRTMDLMAQHYDAYLSHLFERSNTIVKRNPSVCYFDCTNFYFEVESPDEDYVDPITGEVTKGFRKYGPSKQHQPAPLVEMGLFMDAQGIPLSMCLASGSDNEQTLAIPQEKKLLQMLKGKRFIYCADAGLGSLDIRKFNAMGGRAFIVTQSIKKLSDTLQKAVFNDCAYKRLSSGAPCSLAELQTFDLQDETKKELYLDKAYKVVPANRLVDLGFTEEKTDQNGSKRQVKAKGMLRQSLIITFSRKQMEYQRFIRNRQIDRARALLKTLDPETYKKGPHDITRFIKRAGTTKAAGFLLDEERIQEEERYDGFYAIATNLEDDPKDILTISAKRYKIEEDFRILKTNFSGRPVGHRLQERIQAHFLICYTALLLYRLLEVKLEAYCEDYDRRCDIDHTDPKQRTHFTIDQIVQTLRNMKVANVEDHYYMSTYTGSKLCTALNSLFELGLDKKYYLPKELNKKVKKLLK